MPAGSAGPRPSRRSGAGPVRTGLLVTDCLHLPLVVTVVVPVVVAVVVVIVVAAVTVVVVLWLFSLFSLRLCKKWFKIWRGSDAKT